MIPPGLNVKKTPQIKCLTKENKIAWENSLHKTSRTLLDLLISQHSSDLETINKQKPQRQNYIVLMTLITT